MFSDQAEKLEQSDSVTWAGGGQDSHWGLQGAVTLYPVPFSGHSWSSGGLLSPLGQPEVSAQCLEQGCRGSGFPVGLFPVWLSPRAVVGAWYCPGGRESGHIDAERGQCRHGPWAPYNTWPGFWSSQPSILAPTGAPAPPGAGGSVRGGRPRALSSLPPSLPWGGDLIRRQDPDFQPLQLPPPCPMGSQRPLC